MARIAFFTSALLGLGSLTEARQKAANKEVAALPKAMTESLNKIAGRFLSKSEIKALVDMSSPQSRFLEGIDAMQKEIIKECHDETDTFNQWLQSKQDDLNNNNLQLQSLQGHQSDVQNTIAQLQGELSGSEEEQSDLQEQIDQAQKDLQSYQQQLQDAIELRKKSHDQNEAIIAQHKDSLQILQGLRDLVDKFDVSSNEVMSKQLAKVPKLNFLHKKHASKINALITSVKAKLVEAMNKDPKEKQQIKDQALKMIDTIMNGIQYSLSLYQTQEETLQQKFDNEIKPSLDQMISQTQDRISSLQNQLGEVIADHGSIQSDLNQFNDDLSQTESQISTLQGLMSSLQDQIQEGTDSHNKKQGRCKADLDALEEIRQYVVAHTDGATPGKNCHPESPTCPRCLYDAHCSNGQICLDIGVCGVPPTTAPPQRSYYPLITEVVAPKEGRRVDVGVVPQDAFADNDFTYIFKYQQLSESDNQWGNLFNVVDNGDGWPFPNQAALFVTGNMFEIDVCDDSKPWSENYWYRNFYRDQVELGQWNAIAFVVSSSTKTVTFVHRDSAGKIKSQDYPDFHGNPQKFAQTGIYVNGRNYNSLNSNFDDFRRYDRALNADEVEAVFSEFFP